MTFRAGILTTCLPALFAILWLAPASAELTMKILPFHPNPVETDSKPDSISVPEAVALQCFTLKTNTVISNETRSYVDTQNLTAANSCEGPITVVMCVPGNAPRASYRCKTEGDDIGAIVWKIKAKSQIETGMPADVQMKFMACKDPAIPVLVTQTNGKCVKGKPAVAP